MLCFPNTKINIGLNVISKRPDGYHNIETIFYPIDFCDILEILPSKSFQLVNYGIQIDCAVEKNLCFKAYKILEQIYNIPPVKIILHKKIPFGTGLGAGSSNAASTLILLNKMNCLNLSEEKLIEYASLLGADCAFFIKNKPVAASGIGNVFNDIELCLKNKYIVVCIPSVSVNTANAYSKITPKEPVKSLSELVKMPVAEWKNHIKNDFEDTVFKEYPILQEIKSELYENGAVYAQMSGSGAAVFGIFENMPNIAATMNGNAGVLYRTNAPIFGVITPTNV